MNAELEILLPASGNGPGVFVVHPWWGRNATVRAYGQALAAEGFVVGLPDAFVGDVATGRDEAQGLLEKHWQVAPARLTADFEMFAARAEVKGPVAGVGFSF